jgi:hypothetical protein
MQTNIETPTLSGHETQNPYLVFYTLFDYAGLPHLRENLWQWLRLTVTGGYTKKYFDYNDREKIFVLYEHLEKLLEATYLIYQDRKEELRRLHEQILEEELQPENG